MLFDSRHSCAHKTGAAIALRLRSTTAKARGYPSQAVRLFAASRRVVRWTSCAPHRSLAVTERFGSRSLSRTSPARAQQCDQTVVRSAPDGYRCSFAASDTKTRPCQGTPITVSPATSLRCQPLAGYSR